MPIPSTNFFKKDSSSSFILGCLRIGDVRVAVEDGWNETGYRIDYGPTSTTGFFAGFEPLASSPAGNASTQGGTLTGGLSYFGYLINFTGNSPSFTQVDPRTGDTYPNMVNDLSFPGVEVSTTWRLTGICQQRPTKNCALMEYNLFPMVTSGLTSYFNYDWAYCLNRTGLTANTQPRLIDLSHHQNTAFATTGRPAGQGTVRNYLALQMDGIQARVTTSGDSTTNMLPTGDFTWFLYSAVNIPGANSGNQYIWSSVSGGQKNFAIKYFCATTASCSMVIETPSTSYSSTTTGTNFNGFSSNLGTIYFANRYDQSAFSILRKSGTTFDLFWYKINTFTSSPQTGFTKMWTVTINDWSVNHPNVPFNLYYNPQLELYTSGGIQQFATYNRALTDKEIILTTSGLTYNVSLANFNPTFPPYPS